MKKAESDMEKFLKALESLEEGKKKQESPEEYSDRLKGVLKDILEDPKYYDDLYSVIQIHLQGIDENCTNAIEEVIKNPLASSGVVMAEAGTLIEFFSSVYAIVETVQKSWEVLYKAMSDRMKQLEQENKELKDNLKIYLGSWE